MIKITVLKDFHDLKEDCLRKAGDTFEDTRERMDEISSKLGAGYVKAARRKREDAE